MYFRTKNQNFSFFRIRNRGQAMIISVIFFLFISFATSIGLVSSVVREYQIVNEEFIDSKRSASLADSGIEDIFYRLKNSMSFDNTEDIMLNSNTSTVTVNNVSASKKTLTGVAAAYFRTRKSEVELNTGIKADFIFGLQAGLGGLVMQGSSSINGNVYANGPVVGLDNTIDGDVISAGASGLIDDITVGADAYAHSITDSTVSGDVYYQSINNTTVTGVAHSNFDDQVTLVMPITDATITALENVANAGGSVTCTDGSYTISANEEIGPKKVPCDLIVTGGVVTLSGHLWVEGNITMSGSASMVVKGSPLENESIAVIAHGADTSVGSKITISNSATFSGNGGTDSQVVLISQNNSAELLGVNDAIDFVLGATGDVIAYAPHGNIAIKGSVVGSQIAGYKVTVSNSALVSYDFGLVSPLFPTNTSIWNIRYWKQVQ